MASSVLANRVRVSTATSGTGTVTLGAKVSNKYATFAEGGITNSQVVTYTIEDGDDWEVGRGTYTSAGTTLSRDTVLISSVGGTVGTSKLSLSGSAEVFISAAKEDLDVNDFTEDTSPLGQDDFLWMHDASASLKKKAKPLNVKRTGGLQLLASGAASGASLDIPLTSYTAYRAIMIVLTNILPATDDVELRMRFSTDGGSSYDAGASNYAFEAAINTAGAGGAFQGSGGATFISLCGAPIAGNAVGNASAEGVSGTVTIWGQTNTAQHTRATFDIAWGSTSSGLVGLHGTGARLAAQDTDGVQFLFESGNISSGNYAVYGLI
jgi:hypothetical protein